MFMIMIQIYPKGFFLSPCTTLTLRVKYKQGADYTPKFLKVITRKPDCIAKQCLFFF